MDSRQTFSSISEVGLSQWDGSETIFETTNIPDASTVLGAGFQYFHQIGSGDIANSLDDTNFDAHNFLNSHIAPGMSRNMPGYS